MNYFHVKIALGAYITKGVNQERKKEKMAVTCLLCLGEETALMAKSCCFLKK